MLASKAGRAAFRQLSTSTCPVTHRVDPLTLSCAFASTSSSNSEAFSLPLRPRYETTNSTIFKRFYASRPASKPKAHTGRTTTTRTRTRKTAAASTKAKPVKKAAKPRSGTKPKAKSKAKTKARAKPRRRVKKELTAEQKDAAAAKAKRATIRALKEVALTPPKRLPATTYTIISVEKSKESNGLAAKEASAKYKQLLPEEREHYNQIATENKTKNNEAYSAWVTSLPPEDIRKANLARRRLKRMGVKGYSTHIQDSRQVKRPASARTLFVKDRFESGDMRGVNVIDALKLINREWNDLSAGQKQKYFASEMESRAQYVKDVKNTYHRDIVLNDNSMAAQALHA